MTLAGAELITGRRKGLLLGKWGQDRQKWPRVDPGRDSAQGPPSVPCWGTGQPLRAPASLFLQASRGQECRATEMSEEQVGGLTRTAPPASQQHPPHRVSYPLPLATLDLVQIPQPYTRTPGALCAEEN